MPALAPASPEQAAYEAADRAAVAAEPLLPDRAAKRRWWPGCWPASGRTLAGGRSGSSGTMCRTVIPGAGQMVVWKVAR
jgi:hypothetical protein